MRPASKIGSPMLSPIGSLGFSELAGSWNTIPVWRRMPRKTRLDAPAISWPAI